MRKKIRSLADIEEDIQRYTEKQGALKKELIAVMRSTQLYCPNCGRRSTLSRWVFIQTKHYERPHGCTEGDTWHDNSHDKCGVHCSKCSSVFRISGLDDSEKLLKITEKVDPAKVFMSVINESEERNLLVRYK